MYGKNDANRFFFFIQSQFFIYHTDTTFIYSREKKIVENQIERQKKHIQTQ